MSASRVSFVKLGGSLITEKSGREAVRPKTLARLAAEIRRVSESGQQDLVVAHGSGSFGHAIATEAGWTSATEGPSAEAVARTQDAAGRLHRRVVEALLEAGLPAFSLAPGSLMVSSNGSITSLHAEPLVEALRQGLLPVLFGDVVIDSGNRARIYSTERVFLSMIPSIIARGFEVSRVCWLGTTDGILDASGSTIPEITRANAAEVLAGLTGAASLGPAGARAVPDVTGGMRHRLESALALGRLGVASWILDGTVPGRLEQALLGEAVSGTLVAAGRLLPDS